MKTFKLALLAAAGALTLGTAAQAQDESAFALSFNVGAASDYVFRGYSQTDEDPQVFGGVDATVGSIGYVGAWVSNVDFGDDTDFEFDLYAGVKPTLGPVALDLAVIYYGYAGAPSGASYGYWEGKVAGSVPVGPATVGAAVYYSPDFFGGTGDAVYYEVNSAIAIPDTKFSVSGALGHQSLKGNGDYTTWNLGVGFAVTDHIGLDLRYHDTDVAGPLSDDRVVVGIKATF